MKRIYLSQTDKKIAGLFGGIAEVYGLDPSLVRLLAVFLALITGLVPLVVTYVIGWLILPKGPSTDAVRPVSAT
jgi:phage shock protein PspC (stress-responsive transcriptional regulator)